MKRNENSEILFDLNDEGELVDALKSLYKETKIGKEYSEDYYAGDEDSVDTNKLLSAVDTLFPRQRRPRHGEPVGRRPEHAHSIRANSTQGPGRGRAP